MMVSLHHVRRPWGPEEKWHTPPYLAQVQRAPVFKGAMGRAQSIFAANGRKYKFGHH